ncbi:MAG: DUF4276 family protein [Desulfitobacteriaceae bacterium]
MIRLTSVANFSSPEHINEGFVTAPSKRIGSLIPEYLDSKRIAGPLVAKEIGLEKIRQKCRHFNDWLRSLEALVATEGA